MNYKVLIKQRNLMYVNRQGVIGDSLSEPHTGESFGVINHAQKFKPKNGELTHTSRTKQRRFHSSL